MAREQFTSWNPDWDTYLRILRVQERCAIIEIAGRLSVRLHVHIPTHAVRQRLRDIGLPGKLPRKIKTEMRSSRDARRLAYLRAQVKTGIFAYTVAGD